MDMSAMKSLIRRKQNFTSIGLRDSEKQIIVAALKFEKVSIPSENIENVIKSKIDTESESIITEPDKSWETLNRLEDNATLTKSEWPLNENKENIGIYDIDIIEDKNQDVDIDFIVENFNEEAKNVPDPADKVNIQHQRRTRYRRCNCDKQNCIINSRY